MLFTVNRLHLKRDIETSTQYKKMSGIITIKKTVVEKAAVCNILQERMQRLEMVIFSSISLSEETRWEMIMKRNLAKMLLDALEREGVEREGEVTWRLLPCEIENLTCILQEERDGMSGRKNF